MLQKDCYLHKESLRQSLAGLSTLQARFNSIDTKLAVTLLQRKSVEKKLSSKIKGLTWLMSTFAYSDVFTEDEATPQPAPSERIHINNLKELDSTIPLTIGTHWKVTGDCLDSEIIRISILVKKLWNRANEWQNKVSSLIPASSNFEPGLFGNCVKFETLVTLTQDKISLKVIIPDLARVEKVTATARQIQVSLKQELFQDEYTGVTDVHRGLLPDGQSLIAKNGDLVLTRFTGSGMYIALQQTLNKLQEVASQLPMGLKTPESASLDWMVRLYKWVQSLQNAGYYNSNEKLVVKIDHALELLEQGRHIFYTVPDEVRDYLREEKVSLQIFPEQFTVTEMKGGHYTLGIGLLRWSTLLFECLQSDINKEDLWKVNSLQAVDSFTKFEQESIGGRMASFRNATKFTDTIKNLIDESSNLILQDHEVLSSISALPENINNSIPFQQSVEAERKAAEEKQFLEDMDKFTNPKRLVEDRYELLDCLMKRLPPTYKTDDLSTLIGEYDDNTLFAGEQTARDKSRFALEKCLFSGIETLGLDPKDEEIQDFCSIFAWNLEEAVHQKYHEDHLQPITNEYKDKIRSLRFNLQDPKNPMLCARVLAKDMSIQELISASDEQLASTEMKMKRQSLQEEALKDIVLSADNAKKEEPSEGGFSTDLAARICIESTTSKGAIHSKVAPSTFRTEEDADDSGMGLSASHNSGDFYRSPGTPAGLSPALKSTSSAEDEPHISESTKQILASIPPPPMSSSRGKKSEVQLASSSYDFPSPTGSPEPSGQKESTAGSPRPKHIMSRSGTDLFEITISKLKLTFTTKIAEEALCNYELNRFLPSMLVEKGRLSLDELNKFIYEKTQSGRWTIAHLKLSSITGSDNMNSYKKFYKEYEALGRLIMIKVSDTTKIFLVTPKFLRKCNCLRDVENLSRSSTYVVVLTKETLPPSYQSITNNDDGGDGGDDSDDDMF